MRITGGECRGRLVPSPEGLVVRPTASKIRQAFFNILAAKVDGCDFLDVFAGTGLMGMEALSRGARNLVAIEQNKQMVRAIQDGVAVLGYEADVVAGDYRYVLPTLPPLKFDIIFADPPYKTKFPSAIVDEVGQYDLLKSDGILVIEHVRGYKFLSEGGVVNQVDRRDYGHSTLSFFARS